ncbi:MAG: hypothetical protein AB8G99_24265 [Planctomycetaceae bacterium]
MSDLPNAASLIQRVGSRLRLSAIARATYQSFIWLAGIYLVAILVSRLSGFIPAHWFSWQTLSAVPVLAVICGIIFHKRPSIGETAREIDLHANSKDLFLTVSKLDSSAGGYQELVKRDAEQKSEKIEPAKVVPYQVSNRLGPVFVTALAVCLTFLIPQFDPFGKVEAAEAMTKLAEELRMSKKATVARAEQLKKDNEEQGGDTAAEKELKKLTDALKKMRPGKVKKKAQEKVLVERKSNISKRFNAKNSKQLREMLSKQISNQSFGGMSEQSQKAKEWLKDLKEGKSDKLLGEITKMQDKLKAMAKEKDPEKRKEMARELKKDMQDLANFAKDKANSKQLSQALERAMDQMQAGRENEEMSEEAMQAALESLELSKAETENLAQAAKELQKLEQALEAIQMARQLNGEERLDGSEMEGMESIEDYAEMYREMMGEGGDESGEGGSGEGQGEGGPPAEEDDSQETGFKKEESLAQLQAGKNLLSWKTKGMSESGEFKKEVASSLQKVKQGVSEAIKKEQVPPGYVDGIKKYFDNIDENNRQSGTGGSEAAGDKK